ncbi:MAG: YfhO family protein [Candidatus Sumerlaeaceae bacterium]|nr:YfhO family protein [Candidatus Sumerlaeaceae bacterium]
MRDDVVRREYGNRKHLAERGGFGPTRPAVADLIWNFAGYPLILVFLLAGTFDMGAVLSAAEGDVAYYWLWQRYFLADLFRTAQLAYLNPFIMSGTPFLGALQSAALYPLNLLLLLLSIPTVLNFQLLFHWWLTFVGFHVLGRSLRWPVAPAVLCSVCGGLSGWVVLHFWQGHLPFILEMTATPWLLWTWLRWRRAEISHLGFVLVFSIILAVQFSIGHPQIVYFTLLIVCWFELFWLLESLRGATLSRYLREAGILGFAVGLGGCVVGLQAIPTLLYMRETVRGVGRIAEVYYTAQSMPWTNILTLFAPWTWGGWPGRDVYVGNESMWEVVGFVGMTTTMLGLLFFLKPGLLSRFQWAAGLLVVVGVLLALGQYSGLYSVLRKVVPGLGLFRNPGRALFIVSVGAALLAGESLHRLQMLARTNRGEFLSLISRGWVFLGVMLASFLIIFGDGIRSPIFMNMLIERTSREHVAQLSREAVVPMFENFRVNLIGAGVLAAIALAALSRLLWQRYAAVVSWFIVALLFFELTQFARPYMVAFHPERDEWSSRVVSFLKTHCEGYRVTSIRTPADLDQGMRWGIRHVWGYEPTVSFRYASCVGVSQGRPPGFPEAWLNVYRITPLINALGVKYLIAPKNADLSQHGWSLVMNTLECSIHENQEALRRGLVVNNVKLLPSNEVVHFVNSADFLPTSTVVLEQEEASEEITSGSASHTSVVLAKDEWELFEASVLTDGPAWFVVMNQHLPGWCAWVNGKPARIYRANGCGMAVWLPAGGKHEVRLRYVDPGALPGTILSSLGVCGYVALLGCWWLRRRKQCLSRHAP